MILQIWGSALWIGCAALGTLLAGSFLLLGRRQSGSPRQKEASPASLAAETDAAIVQTILTGKVSGKDLESDEEHPRSVEPASCEMLSEPLPAGDATLIMVPSPEMEVFLAKQGKNFLLEEL